MRTNDRETWIRLNCISAGGKNASIRQSNKTIHHIHGRCMDKRTDNSIPSLAVIALRTLLFSRIPFFPNTLTSKNSVRANHHTHRETYTPSRKPPFPNMSSEVHMDTSYHEARSLNEWTCEFVSGKRSNEDCKGMLCMLLSVRSYFSFH